MAEMTNKARVGDAFDELAKGLLPFIDAHIRRRSKDESDWAERFAGSAKPPIDPYSTEDPQFLLRVMKDCWNSTFAKQLPRSMRNLVFTLNDKRNEWAHSRQILAHDVQFTLSGVLTLLEAVDAAEADVVRISLDEFNRAQHAKEQQSGEISGANVTDGPTAGLKPWRDVVLPHEDVASGMFEVAEFAADLELVRKGEAKPEYGDPALFFERTYLTRGLRELLNLGLKRVGGIGGQPVINCQTNFGGGKTHSMIALYHLLSGVPLASLSGEVRELVSESGLQEIPHVNRAVVVGNRFGAGEVHEKDDGTQVNTIWGEIAWQLGGKQGYAIVAESDKNRTNPGDTFRQVMQQFSPCLILIDEWVAYAREMYGRDDLPGGSFDSQFGFAQAITEGAKGVEGALCVVSIPASEGTGAPDEDSAASSLEVGGVAGREALLRLTNITSRVAASWQPAEGDESFEIVRRRLFQPLSESALEDRDATAEAFGDLYRKQRSEFPSECSEPRYAERIKTAYPIHPEVFDTLYEEWATVERFQRTRGVLRLMASTISSLWDSDDRSPLILPCSLPLTDMRVQSELAGKLPEYWEPVISADIDGPQSMAAQIDRETPHLKALHATRRVARTIFLAATPTAGSGNRGVEMERIRLGSTFAGEKPGPLADAINRLAGAAPHLYVDRNRYWFDRQQNVNRTASDRASQFLKEPRHEVRAEIERRLKTQRSRGEFANVHVTPRSTEDVADDNSCRLVVLGPDSPHIDSDENSPSLVAAREMLQQRGSSPRQYKNMLVFAAANQRSLEGLEEATAQYLAWTSICNEVAELNLDAHQTTSAKNRKSQTDEAVGLRLAEAYQYAIVPYQAESGSSVEFDAIRLDSSGDVAERVSRKLVNDGMLAVQYPPVMLRMQLDGPLSSAWEDGDVSVRDLWEFYAKYLYLPRLRDQSVLQDTVGGGPASTMWESEGFAVAAGVDSASDRYAGLVAGSHPGAVTGASLLVRPDFALGQREAERQDEPAGSEPAPSGTTGSGGDADKPQIVTSFRGSVDLDSERPTYAFSQINEEVLSHIISQFGAEIKLTLTFNVTKSDGFDDATVRTVTENARTLGFNPGTGFLED